MPLLFLYSLLYRPLIVLVRLLSPFYKKIQKGLNLRKKHNGEYPWLQYPEKSAPLWFHCASGELEYAKPILRLIKQKFPEQKIMVTYFSPSVEPALRKNKDVDFFCPTPWDTASHWREFIEHHRPKALLIARTDLWPSMLQECRQAQIPALLFSKTVNTRKGFFANAWEGPLLQYLSDIFCVSVEDKSLLESHFPELHRVHATGDTRYDQCLHRITHKNPTKPLNNFNRPIFVAGSTWKKDEEILLPLMKNQIRKISFIIAPHEPTPSHLKQLCDNLKTLKVPFQIYSKTNNWDPESVLIIDQVGILADLYSWGRYAYVGGAMEKSVHSVMEPLALGLTTFIGPFHTNNREALEFQKLSFSGLAPVQIVDSADSLSQKFSNVDQHWTNHHAMDIQMEVKKRAGASKVVLQWIDNQKSPPS
ncbi:MAG: glycosyltransferase N-terminal domain-containing protein [Pseudomonadota bacterium]